MTSSSFIGRGARWLYSSTGAIYVGFIFASFINCRTIPITLSDERLAQATMDERKRLRDLDATVRRKAREKQRRSALVFHLKNKIDHGEGPTVRNSSVITADADTQAQAAAEKQYDLEKCRAQVTSLEFSFVLAEYEYTKAKIMLRGRDDQDMLRFYRRAVTDAYRALAAAQHELEGQNP